MHIHHVTYLLHILNWIKNYTPMYPNYQYGNRTTVNEFDYPWIRNMLEMQMTIFELIQDLEKIAEMRDQIRKVSV